MSRWEPEPLAAAGQQTGHNAWVSIAQSRPGAGPHGPQSGGSTSLFKRQAEEAEGLGLPK